MTPKTSKSQLFLSLKRLMTHIIDKLFEFLDNQNVECLREPVSINCTFLLKRLMFKISIIFELSHFSDNLNAK